MIYLDTSVLGAIFFREAGAANLVARLESQRKAKLMISAWTLTEMASIGGIKQRMGAINADTRQQAIANFQRFASMYLVTVEIDPADFRTAAVLIESPAVLRAGDALHLAIARRLCAKIASLDHRLCAATEVLGMARFELS
ncbi:MULTISPECIES: type II toxin-antitoxin system VapC family toxin [Pseudomonadota]|uniref:type II toxin-antitoxin system VapC family toxin n=1 Tax=Pseudomonadota TaxID=1224 RepID=UPI00262383F9|nr:MULTISPECIES: type II toxin-antitoxin system VapC family toxin [Pseudomonadota]